MGLTGYFQDGGGPLAEAVDTLLDRPANRAVLAVGDLMLDRFVAGRVERISPEAPIPVLAVDRQTAMPGGVGNVVANLQALHAEARLVAVVGQDAEGDELAALLGPANSGLVTDAGRPTAVKQRFLAGGQQLLRADYESVGAVGAEAERTILEQVEARIDGAGALVLSDYGKGVLTEAVLRAAIEAARVRGLPVIVDPKGADYGRYRGAALVTPNLKELSEAAGSRVSGDEAVVSAARTVLARSGIRAMVVTRGGEGLTIVGEGEPVHIRAVAREVFDVSGAGDTVVATLALGLAAGLDLVSASRVANLAAGIVVGKVGTASVTAEELKRATYEGGAEEGKVLPLKLLLDRVERWRRRGLKIGFTNGCFDLLHPGHLSLLRQARATADRLVVGLNSDASVRRLKGETRPVSNEAARAAVLAAVADVDAVTIFEDDTPLKLIEAIRPDVLVKGADYTVEQIVGADIVLSYGGKVVRAQLEAGHSTTATIAKLARNG